MSAFKGTFEWMFFVPMLILLGLFVFFSYRTLRIVLTFEKTTGAATLPETFQATRVGRDFESLSTVSGDRVYFTVQATTYIATSRTRTSSNLNLKENETVTVYYAKQDPNDNRIGIFRELYLVPLIFGVIWFVFFTIWFGTLMGPTAAGTSEEIARVVTQNKS
jgi:hypothetical protein